MKVFPEPISQSAEQLLEMLNNSGTQGLGAILRIQCGLIILTTQAEIISNLNADPLPKLRMAFDQCISICKSSGKLLPHIDAKSIKKIQQDDSNGQTKKLFEGAWTQYSNDTYDHSVGLVEQRLRNSGFNEGWFDGKVCFDGGCGTGRLSLAIAKMGAKQVVAADIGRESLEYFRVQLERYKLKNVNILETDITNLQGVEDQTFDFVASNGVLHHTAEPDQGILEHYRVLKGNGVFWIYLYGKGGIYWEIYDLFKPLMRAVGTEAILDNLKNMGVREGLTYTFMDNFLARRCYYSKSDIKKLLDIHESSNIAYAIGINDIDDPQMQLESKYGKLFLA